MTATPKLVTIFGGSGFVGRYIARRMAKQGWRVRVAVRRPNEAMFVRPYGSVGQVEPILANVRDDASVRAAIAGADAVVNCVGTFDAKGKNNFDAVHVDGAARIARIAKQERVAELVHISALGADADAESEYSQSKAAGEAAVKEHFKSAMILRPGVIFGPEDEFFNRFAKMAKYFPVIPLVGGNTLFQPVYVDDVAAAAEQGIMGQAAGGVYELGGPDIESFADLIARMQKSVRRNRIVIPVPFVIARMKAWGFNLAQTLTLGLFQNTILTPDQVKGLRVDNVISTGAKTFSTLKITPTAMDAVLDEYLYCHRPYGQYTELTESGKNLRT
ncbi:3-beta hydroxysteroid dehydrogenase [Amylibacter kogurei]|uniref:3-beta hydroxysteroid dehydrogenase n=1 Tax=Paramylibacter kogurei TaxID=1889778 RepID=A0A2G5K0I7_9RHOB|nr:complex I NDUFA9 subunit family protein [Amylibacter kogurei]PIB23046.1 3-beta hydroxysteroid dehydrogenase [Amylibacter kogurei]